jgi:Collagen triple helix repeat (20 copies)
MFARVHQRLGTAGFVIAIVALVAALGGGAYAASGGLTGKQKKEVEKIAKKYAGKPGATGATGPAGSKGDTGAQGAQGAKGDQGSQGVQGSPGSAGKEGKEGAPGILHPGETLASEATLTGTWGIYHAPVGTVNVPLSFSIPLREPPAHTTLVEAGETKAGCPGMVDGIPTAEPGNFCVYNFFELEKITNLGIFSPATTEVFKEGEASQTGALLRAECEATFCTEGGAWAVTAE